MEVLRSVAEELVLSRELDGHFAIVRGLVEDGEVRLVEEPEPEFELEAEEPEAAEPEAPEA